MSIKVRGIWQICSFLDIYLQIYYLVEILQIYYLLNIQAIKLKEYHLHLPILIYYSLLSLSPLSLSLSFHYLCPSLYLSRYPTHSHSKNAPSVTAPSAVNPVTLSSTCCEVTNIHLFSVESHIETLALSCYGRSYGEEQSCRRRDWGQQRWGFANKRRLLLVKIGEGRQLYELASRIVIGSGGLCM